MGKARHTPAPWVVGVSKAERETPIGEEFLGVGNKHGRSICRVTRLLTEDEEDGYNASLIAAAPDLLEACRRLLKFNEELCQDANVSTHYPSAEFARAAIAKAEGIA